MPNAFRVGILSVAAGCALLASLKSSHAQLKVDVDLTLVSATVVDPDHRPVTNLEPQNFQLWEDKVEQKIEYFAREEVPVSVGIVFDVSGSMDGNVDRAREAVTAFLKTGAPRDEYFLIEFASEPQMTAGFTEDIATLQSRLALRTARGATAMYDALYLAIEKLKRATNARKALLLITDGEDNHSRYSASDVKELLKEQDIQIYAIGTGGFEFAKGQGGRAAIEELSEITGGRAFFPWSPSGLDEICEEIGTMLKSQFVLGYRSTNSNADGRWRTIRVKVIPPSGGRRLNVKARSGYYAPLESFNNLKRNGEFK